MTDEVPVSDVLLEATEYLCKLGSNLKLRSESLKEKKICKTKLKNTHAVKKAADKLLLICELSKKSLENVENGVKKILRVCAKDQGPIPAKPTAFKRDTVYHYIRDGSQKLRMTKKICLVHFKSVKVKARNMPLSMQEKYPVYFDCKLYRRRKRRESDAIQVENISGNKASNSEDSHTESGRKVKVKEESIDEEKNQKSTRSPQKDLEEAKQEEESPSRRHSSSSKSEKHTQKDNIRGEENKPKIKSEKKEKESSSKSAQEAHTKSDKSEKDHKSKSEYKSKDSSDRKDSKATSKDKHDKKETDSPKKKKHARIVDDSSDEQSIEEKKKESSKPVDEEKSPQEVEVNSDDYSKAKKNREKSPDKKDESRNESKKKKHTRIVDNSSDELPLEEKNESSSDHVDEDKIPQAVEVSSDDDIKATSRNNSKTSPTKKGKVRCESKEKDDDRKTVDSSGDQCFEEKRGSPDKSEKNKSPESVDDSSDDGHRHKKRKLSNTLESSDKDENDDEKQNEGKNGSENLVTQPQKPLIKLVNLSKLLKPEIVKEESKSVTQLSTKDKESYLSRKERKQQERKVKEEKYWDQKRQEVLAFKPKKFHIAVHRLPEFTDNFLSSYKIKIITQKGEIIAKRSKNKTVRFENTDKEGSPSMDVDSISDNDKQTKCEEKILNDSKKHPTPDMDEVKSALLDDSDSENDQNTAKTSAEADKVKKTLLNDSDSDCSSKLKSQPSPSMETAEQSEVISDKNQNTDHTSTEAENVKTTCDSDSDKSSKGKRQSSPSAEPSKQVDNDSDNKSDENEDDTSETPNTDVLNKNTDIEKQNSDEAPEKSTEKTQNQECSSESSNNKDTTPVGSDKEKKSPEKSPITPKSKKKRKNMMESMHAKKMLLTYSSSSDTEDENLKHAIKEIKTSLLEGSDEEVIEKVKENHRKKLLASSSSDDDDSIPKIQNEKEKKQSNKTAEEEKPEKNGDENPGQVDDKSDGETSSSSKMGRSKTKPSSSSHNSDSQETDKDIDGLTNLKTLTKSSRRRGSTSTSQAEDSGANTRSKRMPKVPVIKMSDLLQAATESSAESAGEGDVEDLPPIPLEGLNGSDPIDMGKEQLLDESDASSTHNKSSDEAKQDEESEDEDNPKSKRRKAIAISSDSEGGGRRKKKDRDFKGSDHSDSDSESGEKRSKRKKKRDSDSDASGSSSQSGGKKKRRRIKQVDDSDGSGSGSENEGKKHGRKNIRKVMGKDQLEEATKKAARREKERVARIAERQKLYNNLQFDESGKPDEVVLDKVILDFDPETKEPIIAVDRGLVKKLKPHQANGIKFMWDACFESVKRIKKDKGSGCILAHCMGLGKTLQVVTLTHTLLAHKELTGVRRVLVVCPLSTVLNWVNEFNMWLKHTETDCEVDVYELSRYKQNSERAWQLQQWYVGGGVCVLGYEMFRNLSADNPKKFRKKMLATFQESLVSPGPDLVVCDEGHLLKNEKTSLSQSMNRVKTLRRIVLTGTPLQNNLKEYYCMVTFVKPNLLGKYNEYLNRFVNPITNGQYTDSTEQDIRVMKRRSHVLHTMLDGAVQRRDYGVLAPFLPPKHEYVLFITLSDVQVKLYQHYLDNYSRRPIAGKSGFLFPDFQSLQRIWTHPLVLKYNSERYEIMQQKKRDKEEEEDDSEGSLADFIDDESTDESSTEESSDDMSDASDDSRKKSKKKAKKEKKNKSAPSKRATRANPVEVDPDEKIPLSLDEVRNENPTEWWIKLVEEEELDDLRNSHKLVLLFDILRQCEAIGDKLLVFSQSLYSLDLIEHFLGKVDEATQEARVDEKLANHVGSWSPGVDYFRLDGSTSCENRSLWCKHFNREDNPRARLFLISTRAGGLGINLVAANRVVIFDVSWNPSHDVQSIFRVYRFGQKKPCYVYRFLAMGTMEEKIYERQVTKQAISKRVIDEQQIDRHYAENDLAELYKFEPKPPEPRPLPPLPKDRLFAEMLREHDKQIYKYHEHDSLLENKEEETLTEEERKAAWEDFENEKNRPPPAPFPSVWPMHNGMAPNPLLAQQQQQLAYAAIVSMLRKDMPNVNETQIREMLPLIYNANPALMQKMSEIYKYAPGMMNPMMNAMAGAGPGAAGMGGTSGLQYEPPWQRQQQQQQNMRLQQILQQQNTMNQKYYAGGLGSRDPVAMALQQQAARDIMLGEGQGRPRGRGRPPLARPALPPSQDVVNLDSD